MLLAKVFEPFIENRPVCVMARGILERLLDPVRIDQVFAEHAERQYERDLLFSNVVQLMAEVVLKVQPSVHAAWQAQEYEIGVSDTALYNKLARVETGVSAALVRDSAEQAATCIDTLQAPLASWLKGYRCRVLDGNHLSATEHRLEELRTTWAAPLPGKVLVVLDQERMLAEEVFLTEDGHAQERTLFSEVLDVVRPKDLWIADRNFCTHGFLFGIADRQACFLIRQHGQVKGRLVGRGRRIGRGETGVVYEQNLELTDATTGRMLTIRRITVKLDQPTRDGDYEIHFLTNVPAEDADAMALANLYRRRWTIETMFQEVTTTLACEMDTLCYPPAALFVFCLALLAYNAVSVLKSALRSVHGEAPVNEGVSGYYLALEIRQTYEGMMVAVPARHWRRFRRLTPQEFTETLKEIATHVCLSRYRKHPRGPKKPPPKKDRYKNGGHVSTAKLLKNRKSTC